MPYSNEYLIGYFKAAVGIAIASAVVTVFVVGFSVSFMPASKNHDVVCAIVTPFQLQPTIHMQKLKNVELLETGVIRHSEGLYRMIPSEICHIKENKDA